MSYTAREIEIIRAAYQRQLDYLSKMWYPGSFPPAPATPAPTTAIDTTDAPAPALTPRGKAEHMVDKVLNGGQCTTARHDEMTHLEMLVMFRQLRILFPHMSTNVNELDALIRKEAAKK